MTAWARRVRSIDEQQRDHATRSSADRCRSTPSATRLAPEQAPPPPSTTAPASMASAQRQRLRADRQRQQRPVVGEDRHGGGDDDRGQHRGGQAGEDAAAHQGHGAGVGGHPHRPSPQALGPQPGQLVHPRPALHRGGHRERAGGEQQDDRGGEELEPQRQRRAPARRGGSYAPVGGLVAHEQHTVPPPAGSRCPAVRRRSARPRGRRPRRLGRRSRWAYSRSTSTPTSPSRGSTAAPATTSNGHPFGPEHRDPLVAGPPGLGPIAGQQHRQRGRSVHHEDPRIDPLIGRRRDRRTGERLSAPSAGPHAAGRCRRRRPVVASGSRRPASAAASTAAVALGEPVQHRPWRCGPGVIRAGATISSETSRHPAGQPATLRLVRAAAPASAGRPRPRRPRRARRPG